MKLVPFAFSVTMLFTVGPLQHAQGAEIDPKVLANINPEDLLKFHKSDVPDWRKVAAKIKGDADAPLPNLGKRLWSKATPAIQQLIVDVTAGQKDGDLAILAFLNESMRDRMLFVEEDFAGRAIPYPATALIRRNRTQLSNGENAQLNRFLLESYFQNEVAQQYTRSALWHPSEAAKDALRRSGDPLTALKVCENALANDPDNKYTLLTKAELLILTSKPWDASAILDQLVKKYPDFQQAFVIRAKLLINERAWNSIPHPFVEWLKSDDPKKQSAALTAIQDRLAEIQEFETAKSAGKVEKK